MPLADSPTLSPRRSRLRALALPPLRDTALAVGLACGSLLAHADATSDRIGLLERKLEQSLQRISELNARVQQLEATPHANAVAAAPAPMPSGPSESDKRLEGLAQQVAAMANRSTLDDGLPLHGFASVGTVSSSKAGAKRGATIESVDFYLAPQFSSHVRGLIELNAEVNEEGHVGLDLERLQLGYTVNDGLTLWAGRFHTPYGYWNTAFHHGGQIQTSILRPRFLDFEDAGGILPAHNVGLWGHGRTRLGGTGLEYDAWLANSPHMAVDSGLDNGTIDPSLKGSLNSHAMLGLKVGATPEAWGGLTLGLHTFATQVGGPDNGLYASRNLSKVFALGGYATYFENEWEVLGEYYHFNNRNLNSASPSGLGDHQSWASYLQVGHNFGAWTPYARVEKTSLDQADDYFATQSSGRSYQRTLAGVRYDIDPRAALKLELHHTRQSDADFPGSVLPASYNEWRMQFAVRF